MPEPQNPWLKARGNRHMANRVKVIIDHQTVWVEAGRTILDAASRAGIDIPTLCLPQADHPCQICVVEIEGTKALVPACSTSVEHGMVINTQSDSVLSHRKHVLELKLCRHYGDCISPCSLTCPAGINIQGYISLIARGEYVEALRLIKEKNPLPLSIGRVCPHPCESMCRRMLVEEPLAINHLKRFVADHALLSRQGDISEPTPPTGHRVAIIGGGPAGLSAAYYVARNGHAVTVLEAMPELGGMLRYGIPEYRLPKKILTEEIGSILETGIQVRTGQRLGTDFTLESLRKEGYEAIFIGIGAWSDRRLGVEGEDLPGALSGLEFLRSIASGNDVRIGKRVAVIGGGNSAIDVARTCLRMGAEDAVMLYRRSRFEMPAGEREIREAEADGVRLLFMAAPSRIMKKDGHLQIEVFRTQLGERDKSGRRHPFPVPDSEVMMDVDNIFAAIGQGPDVSFVSGESKLSKVAVSGKNRIVTDPATFETNVKGVFAGGDVVSGPRTVVEAVAAGRKAAEAVHRYLLGAATSVAQDEVNVTRGEAIDEVDLKNFQGIQVKPRERIPERSANERVTNFGEICLGYSQDAARSEAQRCLGCGCVAVSKCQLRRLAVEYRADLSVLGTERHLKYEIDRSHAFIVIDPNKCIYCQRCKSSCEYEAMELSATDFDDNDLPLDLVIRQNERCTSCGKCVDSCPTGALVKEYVTLPVASDELRQVRTICPYCGCGCNITLKVNGRTLVEVTSDPSHAPNFGDTCVKGRFGYEFVRHPERLTMPLVRRGEHFVETTWNDAISLISTRFLDLRQRHGPDALVGLSSAKCTNEENYLMQKFMRAVIGTNNVDHCARL